MGVLLSKLVNLIGLFKSNQKARILCVGLDAAGKTTTLYKLKPGMMDPRLPILPTIGFNVETVRHRDVSFEIWEMGGKHRSMWGRCFKGPAQGLIFMVDSQDRARVQLAREVLHTVLDWDQMCHVPLLVLANKQDLPTSMTTAELTDELCLHTIRQRSWYIQRACALKGEGLYAGLDWLSEHLPEKHETELTDKGSLIGAHHPTDRQSLV